MCLITEQKKAKIANEDIVCYKTMDVSSEGVLYSPYMGFNYELNKVYKERLCFSHTGCSFDDLTDEKYKGPEYYKFYADCGDASIALKKLGLIEIGEGFHAALTKKRLSIKKIGKKIFQCKIPKGSRYYTDATGLIVSNQIIIEKML
jgi:hypothetical protein